jgi:hypothetical protein
LTIADMVTENLFQLLDGELCEQWVYLGFVLAGCAGWD